MGEGRTSVEPEIEPEPQSGLDIASYPKLLHPRGKHAGQTES